MKFRFVLATIMAIAAFASPGFAFLNITSNFVNLSSQSSLGSNATMLNLTFNLSDNTTANITYINFTFGSTNTTLNANQTNLSVCVYNHSVNSTNLLGCNATWNASQTTVPVSFNVSNETQATLLAVYEIYTNATNPMNISLNISSNSSIILDNMSILVNSSLSPQFPIASNYTEVRIIRATSEISPHFVDTNITNQTFRYFVNQFTGDTFNKTIINIPPGYALTNVINYTIVRSMTNSTTVGGCVDPCFFGSNQINITDTGGIKNITVYFTANTNVTSISSKDFNSTIDGTNVYGIQTEPYSGSANVTTKPLINITNMAIIKNTAIVNGTDYWEFNLTVNVSEAILGTFHLKLSDWNSTDAGALIPLTNGSVNYATLRNNTASLNETQCINLTNSYNETNGLLINATSSSSVNLILRMVIPSGTPIASDWWTTYGMLMRVTP